MRIRVSLALVLGLLLCTLATSEVPELMRLTDNTSNDYSLTIFSDNDAAIVRTQAPDMPKGSVRTSAHVKQPKARVQPRSLLLLCSTSEVLHLLCVQRT
jgi:hypothetical protein